MTMNEKMINEQFLVETINASEEEKRVLKTIGIDEGVVITILGKGHIEGSIIVLSNNIILQINPYFIKKINGSLVNEIKKTK